MWTIYKNKKRIKNLKETGDSGYIYQIVLGKDYFQHDTAFGDFKDLNRRLFPDKVLAHKAFNITKDPKDDGYQREFYLLLYKFFGNKTFGSNTKNLLNKEFAEE